MIRPRRALLSMHDKTGLERLGRALSDLGVELISTGGTARALEAAGLAVRQVSDVTGFPELFGGRVKTLHPLVHGGILCRRDNPGDRSDAEAHGITAIDLVACNLYPFERTTAREGVTRAEAIEEIDIGGPCMIRAAAKNHEHVIVLVDPTDYERVLGELAERGGVTPGLARSLALRAFERTAAYDASIAAWLARSEVTP